MAAQLPVCPGTGGSGSCLLLLKQSLHSPSGRSQSVLHAAFSTTPWILGEGPGWMLRHRVPGRLDAVATAPGAARGDEQRGRAGASIPGEPQQPAFLGGAPASVANGRTATWHARTVERTNRGRGLVRSISGVVCRDMRSPLGLISGRIHSRLAAELLGSLIVKWLLNADFLTCSFFTAGVDLLTRTTRPISWPIAKHENRNNRDRTANNNNNNA
jgi:hypothetical protein